MERRGRVDCAIRPWGSHYRSLVAVSGHAWVAFALEHDPQVRDAATCAQAVAGLQTRDNGGDTDDDIPVLIGVRVTKL